MSSLKLDEIITNKEWLQALESVILEQKDVERYLGVNREKTFPKREQTFAALNKINPADIKVLIFGQGMFFFF